MKFIIEPFKGAKPILFNMTSKEIEAIVSIKPFKFVKTDEDSVITDDFEKFHIYYDDEYICQGIEIFEEDNSVYFQDKDLFNMTFKEIEKLFKNSDNEIEYDEGITSKKFGISIYAPDYKEEPNSKVEAIFIFSKDY
ncbi:hypothetical protein M4I33_06425 [Clostridium sp. LY3-2]|uniref:hypothetical protein n=1 Tax=Clostridium sp. LY3-2 TaxID=2942482 RepID=UPI002152047B|nr:hypothetical protein [Clostridium sp. LY3-2]MCR6514512.1 hypothetical protein [Clostridium sp. LY3-2]